MRNCMSSWPIGSIATPVDVVKSVVWRGLTVSVFGLMIGPSEPMPAMKDVVPVLGGVQAPRVARPLRACGLDPACAPGRGHLSPAVRVACSIEREV
jgi:hypothetical protein